MKGKKSKEEQFKVSSGKIVEKIKKLVKEGTVRRIIIKKEGGETLMEFPLHFAIAGVILAPVLAAVGTLAALATNYIIVIVRKEK